MLMRALFTSAAGLGHLLPLVPLARAALAAGDEVLFAVPGEGLRTVDGFGFAATVIPDGDPGDIAEAWAHLPDHDVNTYVVADIFVRIQAMAALPALQTAISAHWADVVLTTEFGGIVAAEMCEVPDVLVGIAALDLADLDLKRVSDAVDDLREAAGVRRTGQLPYATGTRYLSPIPPMLWADEGHLPRGWLWYRHEDAEGPVAPVQPNRTGGRPRVYATLGSVAGGNDRNGDEK
jgi:UDP:flavonoid glycosyltransferase YjiC (YdhE family)